MSVGMIPVAHGAGGVLDPSFGDGGIVTTAINGEDAVAEAVALQPDGKIVAAGWSREEDSLRFLVARYNLDGSLDATFGGDGIVSTSVGTSSAANALVIQPDGKIVAAGFTLDFPTAFALVRYNADGSLDASFGSGGRVTTYVGQPNSFVNAVALQSDGKIVVGGGNQDGGPAAMNFIVARYDAQGALDGTFGSGGIAFTNFDGNGGVARDLLIQPDGKIVEVGVTSPASFPFDRFALVRFNPNGTLDSSFGSAGKVTTTFAGSSSGLAVALQSNGKLIAAGQASESAGNGGFGLARYNPDGSLDPSFGDGGTVRTDFGGAGDPARAVALQADGKIVAGGHFVTPSFSGDFALARYTPDGSLDSSFGVGGKVTTDLAGASEAITGLAIQPDGKVVAAGVRSPSGNAEIALVRYRDVADATPPVITTPTGIVENATSPDGAIVSYSASAVDDVDGPVAVDCSPASGDTFPIGTTQVTCSASDAAGNEATASFDVHVRGAGEQLDDLVTRVAGLGPGSALSDMLIDARIALDAGDDTEACEKLNAFANAAQAQSGKKLTAEEAGELVSSANRIRSVLDC